MHDVSFRGLPPLVSRRNPAAGRTVAGPGPRNFLIDLSRDDSPSSFGGPLVQLSPNKDLFGRSRRCPSLPELNSGVRDIENQRPTKKARREKHSSTIAHPPSTVALASSTANIGATTKSEARRSRREKAISHLTKDICKKTQRSIVSVSRWPKNCSGPVIPFTLLRQQTSENRSAMMRRSEI